VARRATGKVIDEGPSEGSRTLLLLRAAAAQGKMIDHDRVQRYVTDPGTGSDASGPGASRSARPGHPRRPRTSVRVLRQLHETCV